MQEKRLGEKKTLHSFQRHQMEEGEGTKEEPKRTEERPCMCMHTTNTTDRHVFFLCLVCDQLLQDGSADCKTSCARRPLDTERRGDGHDEGARRDRHGDEEGRWKRNTEQWAGGRKVLDCEWNV